MKEINGILGVADIFPEKIENGNIKITPYTFKEEDDFLFNLRAVRDGGDIFRMVDGDYVRLHVNGELMMSDTRMERLSNSKFISSAHGRILIAGLGIGLVLRNIFDNPKKISDIEEVIVVEKEKDLIDIVGPKFSNPKLEIVHADIWNYVPEGKFDVIYFDIWQDICEDNLDDMKLLHDKFKPFMKRGKIKYMDSWMKGHLKRLKHYDYE